MKKIESLTPGQQIAHDEWFAECMRIGTCTDPADRKRAESAMGKMYQFIGKPLPTFVWCDSPATCILARFILQEWLKNGGDKALRSSLESSLGSSLRSSLESSLRSSLWSSLWSSYWGQYEQYWIGFYRFMELTLKIAYDPEKSAHLGWWQDIAESANWWFPYEGFCFVSERPIRCAIDTERRLHHDTKAAMEFKDGWKVYSYHGTTVPAHVIESPETITIEQIKKEDNAEVRRCMVERMGWQKFVDLSELKVLHTDTLKSKFPSIPSSAIVDNNDPAALRYESGEEKAELLESAFLRDFEDRPVRFVRLTCPSTGKVYIQRVAHDETRVYAAVGKAFGMSENEYKGGRYYRQGDVLLWALDQADQRIVQQHS